GTAAGGFSTLAVKGVANAGHDEKEFPKDRGGGRRGSGGGGRVAVDPPRAGRNGQGGRAPLALRHHGHQRGIAPRRVHDGVRRDQRQGRGHGQEDGAGGGGSRLQR